MRAWMAVGIVVCMAAGCSEAARTPSAESTARLPEATKAAFNVDGAPTVVFSVPEMMCEQSCVPQVREILAAQPGVKDVAVSLETKQATVAVDRDEFDPKVAIAALVDVQFKSTKLVDEIDAGRN